MLLLHSTLHTPTPTPTPTSARNTPEYHDAARHHDAESTRMEDATLYVELHCGVKMMTTPP